MELSYSEYQQYLSKIARLRSAKIPYIPAPEDLERMITYSKTPRLFPQDIPVTPGRKYEYERNVKFVPGGPIGESCITDDNICMYMLYIAKTVKPATNTDAENLEYLKKRLREMLIIRKPEVEEEST